MWKNTKPEKKRQRELPDNHGQVHLVITHECQSVYNWKLLSGYFSVNSFWSICFCFIFFCCCMTTSSSAFFFSKTHKIPVSSVRNFTILKIFYVKRIFWYSTWQRNVHQSQREIFYFCSASRLNFEKFSFIWNVSLAVRLYIHIITTEIFCIVLNFSLPIFCATETTLHGYIFVCARAHNQFFSTAFVPIVQQIFYSFKCHAIVSRWMVTREKKMYILCKKLWAWAMWIKRGRSVCNTVYYIQCDNGNSCRSTVVAL